MQIQVTRNELIAIVTALSELVADNPDYYDASPLYERLGLELENAPSDT